jgi:DNA-3-methyladenine glycosylase
VSGARAPVGPAPQPGPLIDDQAWFDRPADAVAPDLLGTWLIHDTHDGRVAGTIVEVEAYRGPEDLAAHSARGRTARNEVMFGEPGRLYVYLIYGIHHCLNVVCGPGTKPEAVLIRAVAIGIGEDLVRRRRGIAIPPARLASGPGNVGAAFGIDLRLNGADLLRGPLRLAHGSLDRPIIRSPRIGVDYAREWAGRPLRFHVADDPHVSRR